MGHSIWSLCVVHEDFLFLCFASVGFISQFLWILNSDITQFILRVIWDEMGQTSEKDLVAWSLWWASKHINRWSAPVHPTAALLLACRGFKSQTVYLWLDADILMYHVTFWDSILMKHYRRDRGLLSHNISKHLKVQLCKLFFSL